MSGSKFSLIDLRALSEPACKLIDAVSNCIGTLYEPTRIRRKAKAEADAALILTEADAGRQALLKRAAHRLAIQEVRRQKNIEKIIDQAIKSLPETVSDEPVDPDWISRFFDECKDVSKEQLQLLWAKLLAREVSSPGLYSRRTLDILKNLSEEDGNLFNLLCKFIWSKDDAFFIPYRRDIDINAQFRKYNINYAKLLHLSNIGLIYLNDHTLLHLSYGDKLNYIHKSHLCYWSPNNMIKQIYVHPLTIYGVELLSVVDAEIDVDYYSETINMFTDYCQIFMASPFKNSDN